MRTEVAWRFVIFVPGISGGVKVSVWQEGEAWMREGRRRERIGRVDSMGDGMIVLRVLSPSVLLSSTYSPSK